MEKEMKILLTGGTGLIGRAFIEQYKAQYDIFVLSRKQSPNQKRLRDEINIIEELPEQNIFDVIINLAGEPIFDKRWSNNQKEKLCQSRWAITGELIDFIARSQHKPACFISGSAIGYYGDTDGAMVTEHDSVKQVDFSHQLCQKWEWTALQAEKYCRVVLLRTGIVLSEQGGALSQMLPAFKAYLGGALGKGDQWMSWIHIQDMVNIIKYCIDNPLVVGAINCCSPNAVTNKEFSQTLAKVLDRPCFMVTPGFVLKFVLGERSALLLGSQNIYPEKLQVYGFEFDYPELEPAFKQLLAH